MEFNPLDLLASAAELQQRHDDPPNIMTRQKRATTLSSKIITISSAPKENKDVNKSGKSNGVIVLKKIRIGANSDLEKMLDEHNYGNAKKGIKFEKTIPAVSDDSSVSEVINSLSSGRDYENNESTTCETNSSLDKNKCDQPGKSTTLDNSCVSPIVRNENNVDTKLSLEAFDGNEAEITLRTDEQGHQSGVVSDNLPVKTDNADNKMCNDTKIDTVEITETENSNSDSCLPAEKSGTDQFNNSLKKVIVQVNPENKIGNETKKVNKEKVSSESSCDDSNTEAHWIGSEKIDCFSDRSCVEEKSDYPSCQQSYLVKDDCNSKSVTIIRSLLTTDNNCCKSVKTAKLHNGSLRVNCDTENYLRVLEGKMDSFVSPKSRLELDSFCNSPSNGIHLLSPDRRNPDSVGIVESPVTSSFTDSSNSCEMETEKLEHTFSPKSSECNQISLLSEETDQNTEVLNTEPETKTEEPKLDVSNSPSPAVGQQKIQINVKEPDIKQGTLHSQTNSEEKVEKNVFRFESDHCYAGLPGRVNNIDPRELPSDEETDSDEEEEDEDDVSSPSTSPTELSQDSGYGDVTQSPDCEKKEENVRHNPEKLVPVLISISKSGSLTVHTDKGISKELPKQIFTLPENQSLDSNANLLNVDKAQNITKPVTSSVRPLLLSPIGKGTASVLIDPSKILVDPKTLAGIVSPPAKAYTSQTQTQQVSPPKFGKFRIGTFASFSNTGMDIDSPVKDRIKNERTPKTSPFSRSSSHPSSLSSLKSPGDRSLLRRMDSYRGSSSSLTSPVAGYSNHIQHDHDYCMHSFMPSTIDSAKENNQKENVHKSKSNHFKTKKYESELQKELLKNDKPSRRKGKSVKSNVEKDDSLDEMELMLDEERYRDLPTYAESVRAKTRTEKYIEQKNSEPKMKITGSSSFQDQFVYFMSTKKRSRRRESRDTSTPFQAPYDRILPPHKPGDIVVPHLTDADIENLKLLNKQNKSDASENSDPFHSKLNLPNSQSTNSETGTDEESKIINTILSLENENLTEEQVPYSENLEMYGQNDIMNLLPEQMNLTQEQMDILFSAVDEVQNSSPSLVPEKLASGTEDSPFGHFPAAEPSFTNQPPIEADSKVVKQTDGISVDNKPDVAVVTERQLDPVISPAAEDSERSQCSADVPAEQDLMPKVPDGQPENLNVPNCDTDNNLVTGASVISKTPAALSEVISDTVTTGSFTSLTQNSDSDCVENPLGQVSNSSLTFPNLPTPVNTDLPLPTLDKSSLDILGNDYRLDRSDLFPEAALQDTPQPVSATVPVPTPLDYNAPWIVTVSMYWNDLPAIMINNLPYVRLVDIHKQILPAKDTGILKKRCQLMGIEVGNCTEMQRYFLVQYGKAINSKSTLIVSKDAAKVLIGYYVDPQPAKCSNGPKEHKSIIEHRREQLRRIALAKRAALRAERLEKERSLEEAKAGSNLMKPVEETEADSSPGVSDPPVAPPRQRSHLLSSRLQHTLIPGSKPLRSTRHKKINFLELLRGDSSANLPDHEETTSEMNAKKKQTANEAVSHVKSVSKRKRLSNSCDSKNVKVVKYTETDTIESVSDSDYTDEDSSDSAEPEKFVVVKKPKKKRHSLFNHKAKKRKYKKKVMLKKNIVKVPSFKVKFRQGKQVSKDQIKLGKDASISRVHIVKMGSNNERSVYKPSIKKETAVDEISVPLVSNTAADIPDEIGINSVPCMDEKSITSNNLNNTIDISRDEITNSLQVSDNADNTKKDEVEPIKDYLSEMDTAFERKKKNDSVDITQDSVRESYEVLSEEKDVKESVPEEFRKGIGSEKDTNATEIQTELKEPGETMYSSEKIIKGKEREMNSSEDSENSENIDKLKEAGNTFPNDSAGITQMGVVEHKSLEHEHLPAKNTSSAPTDSCSSPKDLCVKIKENNFEPIKSSSETDNFNSGKTHITCTLSTSFSSDSCLSEASSSRAASRCSENGDSAVSNVNFYLLNKDADVVEEVPPVRIVHRDSSPQSSGTRNRGQLGEIFVELYSNKRAFCVRCYTCRKMMSVDLFLRHLHDVSGGLISIDYPQTIEPSDSAMTDSELKAWEVFQRKKELFDNNQLPSDVVRSGIMCNNDSDSNLSSAEKTAEELSRGPIIIQTPVSPVKTGKVKVVQHSKPDQRTNKKIPALSQPRIKKTIEKSQSWSTKDARDGIRASSRKRKASQLYSSDEYTFDKKLPRLQNE